MQTIHKFHQNKFFEKHLDATFIALIPRKIMQKSYKISDQ